MATTQDITGQPVWKRRINDDGTHILIVIITVPDGSTDQLEFIVDRVAP